MRVKFARKENWYMAKRMEKEWDTFSDARKREEVRYRGERVTMTTMAGVQWLTLTVVLFLTLAAFSTPTTPGQQALLQFAFDLESLAAVVAADSVHVDDARHGLKLRRDFRRRPLNLHEDPFGALQLESQILGGIDGHDLAAIDDHDAIAGLLDLGKNVR